MNSTKYGIPVAALAGVTLLIGGTEGAQAATTGDNDSFNIGPSSADINSSSNVALDKFNSALGTLTGVKFTLTSDTETTASVEASSESVESSVFAETRNDSSFEVQVNNPAIGTLFGPQAGEAFALRRELILFGL